jgi:hypothetical protein
MDMDSASRAAKDSASRAIKEYASQVFKQTEYRRVAQQQIREFDTSFKVTKGQVRTDVFEPLGISAIQVPISSDGGGNGGGSGGGSGGGNGGGNGGGSAGAHVFVTRVRSTVPGTLTAKRLEEYTARMVNADEIRSLQALAAEIVREGVEERRKEEEASAKAREKEDAKARREMLKKEREETQAERKRVRDANRAAKDAYEERVRSVEGIISRAKKSRK